MNSIAVHQSQLHTMSINRPYRGHRYSHSAPEDLRARTTSVKTSYNTISRPRSASIDRSNEKVIFNDPYERQFTFSLKDCGSWVVSLLNHSMAVRGLH